MKPEAILVFISIISGTLGIFLSVKNSRKTDVQEKVADNQVTIKLVESQRYMSEQLTKIELKLDSMMDSLSTLSSRISVCEAEIAILKKERNR